MKITEKTNVQDLIKKMEEDVQKLEVQIQARGPEKKPGFLQRVPVITPFLKAVLLTISALFVMILCNFI